MNITKNRNVSRSVFILEDSEECTAVMTGGGCKMKTVAVRTNVRKFRTLRNPPLPRTLSAVSLFFFSSFSSPPVMTVHPWKRSKDSSLSYESPLTHLSVPKTKRSVVGSGICGTAKRFHRNLLRHNCTQSQCSCERTGPKTYRFQCISFVVLLLHAVNLHNMFRRSGITRFMAAPVEYKRTVVRSTADLT